MKKINSICSDTIKNTKNKKTIVFDFDGVVHSYTSGWQGDNIIPDPPVPGIREAIKLLRQHYNVVIVSTRTKTLEGSMAVMDWLELWNIKVDEVSSVKPPAICYIDDRAICFDGNPNNLIFQIMHFKPWYEATPSDRGIPDTMGGRIKMQRLALHMTIDELSERAGIGQTALSDYEHDRKVPRCDYMYKLTLALLTTFEWLYKGEGNRWR